VIREGLVKQAEKLGTVFGQRKHLFSLTITMTSQLG
jgi:hypothetical protein